MLYSTRRRNDKWIETASREIIEMTEAKTIVLRRSTRWGKEIRFANHTLTLTELAALQSSQSTPGEQMAHPANSAKLYQLRLVADAVREMATAPVADLQQRQSALPATSVAHQNEEDPAVRRTEPTPLHSNNDDDNNETTETTTTTTTITTSPVNKRHG
jgi:hypothetical protein